MYKMWPLFFKIINIPKPNHVYRIAGLVNSGISLPELSNAVIGRMVIYLKVYNFSLQSGEDFKTRPFIRTKF